MKRFITRYSGPLGFLAGIIVIAVIAFCFFYPDASEGNVLRQHDMQQGIAIGQEAKAYAEATGHTPYWTNSLFSGMPTFQISPSYPSSAWYKWIDRVMGLGLPSPSNLLAMMMIGFFILLLAMQMRWPVALMGAVAYGLSSYFIIIIGAGHIWKFVTLAYIPPTIAGMVLCYRGRYLLGGALAALFGMMQIASNHVQMTYYFLFVIIALAVAYFIKTLYDGGRRQWLIGTAVLVLAGALAVAANSPSLYFTYEYSKETMRGRHSELSQGAVPSTQATSGLDKDYITQYSYQPSETFSLLVPNIKGGGSMKPEKGSMKMLSLSDLPDAQEMASKGQLGQMEQQYLSYMSQYFGDPEGTNGPVYVGALIVALFLLGCVIVKGPIKWTLVFLTIFSIALAWGRHAMVITDFMLEVVPMYSKFRTVESILVIAEFTMPLLAAMTLQKLVSVRDTFEDLRRPIFWCFGIVMGLCLLGVCFPEIYGSPISENDREVDAYITQSLLAQGYDQATARQFSLQNPAIYDAVETLRLGLVSADALRSFLVVGIGFALICFYMRRSFPDWALMGAFLVLVGADLYAVGKRYVDHESFVARQLTVGPPIAITPTDQAILTDKDPSYRVMDIPRFSRADPSYYHKAIGGYHAAKLTRYQDLIDRHLSHFQRGTETDADWNVLNMLNARYIIGMDGQPVRNPEAYGNGWLVDSLVVVSNPDDEMAALSHINPRTTAVTDRAFVEALGRPAPAAPGDTVVLTSYAPDRLTYTVKSAARGIAVFSEVYFPWGWRATVNGTETPLARVDYLLRALPVPAGTSEVVMEFDPPSLHATDTLAKVSVIVIYVALGAAATLSAAAFLKRRRREEDLRAMEGEDEG